MGHFGTNQAIFGVDGDGNVVPDIGISFVAVGEEEVAVFGIDIGSHEFAQVNNQAHRFSEVAVALVVTLADGFDLEVEEGFVFQTRRWCQGEVGGGERPFGEGDHSRVGEGIVFKRPQLPFGCGNG